MFSNFEFNKPGMRNIKTAISVFVCIAILKLFTNSSPFYACIASIITMQSTVESSIETGFNRMTGTIIGALVGVIFSYIPFNHMVITGAGIVIVIYLTTMLKKKESVSIACIVYLAIMVNIKETTPLIYSSLRVLETFLGITVAVIINSLIKPPNK